MSDYLKTFINDVEYKVKLKFKSEDGVYSILNALHGESPDIEVISIGPDNPQSEYLPIVKNVLVKTALLTHSALTSGLYDQLYANVDYTNMTTVGIVNSLHNCLPYNVVQELEIKLRELDNGTFR